MLLTIIATFFVLSKMNNTPIKSPVEIIKETKERKEQQKEEN